jgi:hypothetical protein
MWLAQGQQQQFILRFIFASSLSPCPCRVKAPSPEKYAVWPRFVAPRKSEKGSGR